MKILVVGSGGREHAMCRALAQGHDKVELVVAPGNPGTAACARNAPVKADDVTGLVDLAKREKVAFVVVGPEAALVKGLADALQACGIPCCGPTQKAAQLEASKAFTRRLAAQLNLPQPHFVEVTSVTQLDDALSQWQGEPPVVKADGLAAGKGVFLPDTLAGCAEVGRALFAGKLGDAGKLVVLEERLTGPEASLFFACAQDRAVPLPHARDHKRLRDADQGPNTGGMGAISPNPLCDNLLQDQVQHTFVLPVLRALQQRGTPFCGFLFVGLMLTPKGPQLLEFNVRLGDPEAQAILPRLGAQHFLRLCEAMAQGNLPQTDLQLDPRPTCAVVLSAAGYPDKTRTGDTIHIGEHVETDSRWVIHAGTAQQDDRLVTAGGRVLTVVAQASTPAGAREYAYKGVRDIKFEGMQVRADIGGVP